MYHIIYLNTHAIVQSFPWNLPPNIPEFFRVPAKKRRAVLTPPTALHGPPKKRSTLVGGKEYAEKSFCRGTNVPERRTQRARKIANLKLCLWKGECMEYGGLYIIINSSLPEELMIPFLFSVYYFHYHSLMIFPLQTSVSSFLIQCFVF